MTDNDNNDPNFLDVLRDFMKRQQKILLKTTNWTLQ